VMRKCLRKHVFDSRHRRYLKPFTLSGNGQKKLQFPSPAA
jgi:hypothetical protein